MSASAAALIADHLAKGCRVAVGDGAGAPLGLGEPLAEAAQLAGGVRLVLGWCLALPVPLDSKAFLDVRSVAGGYALRRWLNDGRVRYVPARQATLPALFTGPLRPDALVAGVRRTARGFVFGSEVSWMRAAVRAGARVLAEVNHGLPDATRTEPIPADQVVVVAEVDRPPIDLPVPPPDEVTAAVARSVAALIPEGATIQFPPGRLGRALVDALDVPVRIRSGILCDPVVDLAERGLLRDDPVAAYLIGTSRLYRWADGRPLVGPLEETHDPSALARQPYVAVNTTLEIDTVGQLNIEAVGADAIGGIGGQPDFALAGAMSVQGLSIVAVASRGPDGSETLVDRLSSPASTLRSDVDLVVNEHGVADLRGLADGERRRALLDLWRAREPSAEGKRSGRRPVESESTWPAVIRTEEGADGWR